MKSNLLNLMIFTFTLCMFTAGILVYLDLAKLSDSVAIFGSLATVILLYLAHHQNQSGSQISQQQAAANLNIEEAGLQIHPGLLSVNFRIRNYGSTPANAIAYEIETAFMDGPQFSVPDLEEIAFTSKINQKYSPLSSQGFFDLEVQIPSSPDLIKMMLDGLKIFYLKGHMDYKDVFGKSHQLSLNCKQGPFVDEKKFYLNGGWKLKPIV